MAGERVNWLSWLDQGPASAVSIMGPHLIVGSCQKLDHEIYRGC
jgi:hypothetical protein